jgi:voltage-gated potassium channel
MASNQPAGIAKQHSRQRAKWRDELYIIIFEADTPAGLLFDVGLLLAILLSVVVVSLETVEYFETQEPWPAVFNTVEWTLTLLFTAEYLARLVCVRKPLRYAFSFFGIVDLLACLPLYLTLLELNSKSLAIVRSIRLLRIFRVLKMMRMLREANKLRDAMWQARDKILVFVAVVMVAVTISGTLMYQIEHNQPGSKFESIPVAMYWAIVTMSTVGYGDIVAVTVPGQIISAVLIILGYSLIIVPTGFVSAEIQAQRHHRELSSRSCPHCMREGHAFDAVYCSNCGERLIASVIDEA